VGIGAAAQRPKCEHPRHGLGHGLSWAIQSKAEVCARVKGDLFIGKRGLFIWQKRPTNIWQKRPTNTSGLSWAIQSKAEVCVSVKRGLLYGKRDLPILAYLRYAQVLVGLFCLIIGLFCLIIGLFWQRSTSKYKCPYSHWQTWGMRMCQKRPIHRQKRPVYITKEAYLYGKRGLFIWQKRPVYMAKEACLYGKRGLLKLAWGMLMLVGLFCRISRSLLPYG